MDSSEEVGTYFDRMRRLIEHEDDLISQRLTWFLTFNGFLYAGLGWTFGPQLTAAAQGATTLPATTQASFDPNDLARLLRSVQVLISIAGLVSSVIALAGTSAAHVAILARISQYESDLKLFRGKCQLLPDLMSRSLATRMGVLPGIALPTANGFAWYYLVCRISAGDYFWSGCGALALLMVAIMFPVLPGLFRKDKANPCEDAVTAPATPAAADPAFRSISGTFTGTFKGKIDPGA